MNHPSMNSTRHNTLTARTPRRPSAINHLARPIVDALTFLTAVSAGKPTRVLLLLLLLLTPPLPHAVRAQTVDAPAIVLADAHVNDDYTLQLGAEGSTTATVWQVAKGGRLPPGVELNSTNGRLHVKPTTAQLAPYVFTIEVFDAAAVSADSNAPALFSQTFSMHVSGPVRRITISAQADAAGQPDQAAGSDNDNDPCKKKETAQKKQTDEEDETEPLDVESNSDTISIAVRNRFAYDPAVTGKNAVIDLKDRKLAKEPIRSPEKLIASTIGKCGDYKWEHDDYVIVHLVKWPDKDPPVVPAGNPIKYEVQKEKWFLYRNTNPTGDAPKWEPQTIQGGARIFGHRRVAVLLVHLTARETWDIKYTVDVKKKIPAPIQNAIDLAGIILGGPNLGVSEKQELPPSYWGGRILLLQDIPANISVKSDIAFLPSGRAVAGLTAAGVAVEKDQQTQQPKSYEKVYDNEGRYRWDVSVGMPLKSFKEVKYDAENGQVTAREVNRQNAYGFLNLFFRKVDTKGSEYSYSEFYKTTHLVLGVPISGKPLDNPVVGLGFGFYKTGFKFNVFAGAVFNRVREPRTLAAGQTATPAQLEGDLQTRRVTKFIFGFNIPVKQFKDALAPKK